MLAPNPMIGVVFHWLGGLAAGSFYTPFRFVRKWAWEVYWLAGGIFSWIIAPWLLASLLTTGPLAILREAGARTLLLSYFFGVLWGFGGLTFGLTMRYLGISLGYAVVLGLCAAFGTLIPPLAAGQFATKVLGQVSGRVILLGVGVCLAGISLSGAAGVSKEREMTTEEKRTSVQEFNFGKGLIVAVFSGIMSACMSYGLAAAEPIKAIAIRHGTGILWQGLPALIVVLLGGFSTNFLWCLFLMLRDGTGHQYFPARTRVEPALAGSAAAGSAAGKPLVGSAVRTTDREEGRAYGVAPAKAERVPLLANYLLCALAGVTWYLQFFFYTMGESQMGAYKFSSWTLHMASIILFSTLWGLALKEWKGTSAGTRRLLFLGLFTLVASTVVVGYGNYLAAVR